MSGLAERYGPWALIAGASEGTGAEFARQLAEEGLNLILVARREGPLDALAAELAGSGVKVVTATVDLAGKDAVARLAEVAAPFEVGLLVFNAGADPNGVGFLDGDLAAWTELATRNCLTVMAACHHFGRLMRARGRGGLLVCGSGVCYGGIPGIGVYGATKAFDLNLMESLWAELKPNGIDVLYLVMGRTDTPAHRKLTLEQGRDWEPETMASAADVARLGLERLPHGPIQNWGLADDEAGWATISAADRRRRIEAIAGASSYAKKG
ncbi:SDR family oxidoreductase [Novosphingobium sp. TH158]|uniref:SDR family NAD(P)-dependent oxidoreductase n=1 Tax=Novosphingobium sp. TH158 TaxID=2067455 RepID=UPI00156EC2E5|nr:SDR family NAD(P)-dependent oxidoreductase [Novosphingobium sp. TH158]